MLITSARNVIPASEFPMDLSGGPMVNTLPFHCRVHRFNPWLGN